MEIENQNPNIIEPEIYFDEIREKQEKDSLHMDQVD
jgi:hypothetical protein